MSVYGNSVSPNWEPCLSFLRHFNVEDLNAILEDDDKVDEQIKEIEQIKQLANEKEMMFASNKSLAQYNLDKEPKLRNAKQLLMESYSTITELMEEFKTKKAELDSLSSSTSLETTLALLQTSAAESEEEAEAISEQFLQNEIDVENFLESFQSKRHLCHLRRVKSDKMAELVASHTSQQRSQQVANAYLQQQQMPPVPMRRPPMPPQSVNPAYANYPVYPPPQPPARGSYPYPLVPSMPMPSGYRAWPHQ